MATYQPKAHMMAVKTPKTIISSGDIAELLRTTDEKSKQNQTECQEQNKAGGERVNFILGETD